MFDSHCHLLEASKDTKESKNKFILMSTRVSEWEQVKSLYRDFPERVVPAFGIHPWRAHQQSNRDFSEKLVENLKSIPTSIVGEIGIDRIAKDRKGEPLDIEHQWETFRTQFNIAIELDKPISMHLVHDHGRFFQFVSNQTKMTNISLHSYSGSAESIRQLVKKSERIYFGYSIAINARSSKLDECILATPDSRILIESDLSSWENVESDLDEICSRVALVKGWTREDCETILQENTERFIENRI